MGLILANSSAVSSPEDFDCKKLVLSYRIQWVVTSQDIRLNLGSRSDNWISLSAMIDGCKSIPESCSFASVFNLSFNSARFSLETVNPAAAA